MESQGISYQTMPSGVGYGDNGLAAAALACAVNGRRDDYGHGFNNEGCLMSAIESTDDHVVSHMGQTANQTQTIASQVSNGTLTLANQLCGVSDGLSGKIASGFSHVGDNLHSTEARLQQDIYATSGRVSDGFHRQSNELCAGFGRVNDHISNFERGTEANFSDVLVAIKESQYNTAIAVRDDGDKTRGLVSRQYEDELNRKLGVAESALADERNSRRIRDVEVNVSQTVTQAQNQQQQQAQLQGLFRQFADIANDLQQIKQGQVIFNSGVMAASGTQAAANTRVSG